MKILAIDDQQLILLPLEKRLKKIGYEVQTETDPLDAIHAYKKFQPDLVIVDINISRNISGLDIISYIRATQSKDVFIIVLSGKTDTKTISKAYEHGINDYLKKPLSLHEICLRIQQLTHFPNKLALRPYDIIIQKRCVGVVIPCYNEADRLLNNKFIQFIDKHTGYFLCFVNDGSTDNTLEVLNNLQKGREDFVHIYNCQQNKGKAEAVRLGMLYLNQYEEFDYIGFLDADLSTDFCDFEELVRTIESSNYKIVSGSRIDRMGANISKNSFRGIISKTINFFICSLLQMNFKDTQCGAKVFRKDIINISFKNHFVSKWLFDIEIFLRLKKHYSLKKVEKMICEKPLNRWIHVDGSKLSFTDSLKILLQLFKIGWNYKQTKIFSNQ